MMCNEKPVRFCKNTYNMEEVPSWDLIGKIGNACIVRVGTDCLFFAAIKYVTKAPIGW